MHFSPSSLNVSLRKEGRRTKKQLEFAELKSIGLALVVVEKITKVLAFSKASKACSFVKLHEVMLSALLVVKSRLL